MASVMCLRTIVRGSRSRSWRSEYSGPSSLRSSSRALVASPRARWSSWAAWRARSGSLSGPSTMTATRAITASSRSPTSNMLQNLLPGRSRGPEWSELAGRGEPELHAGEPATAPGQRLRYPGELTRGKGGRVSLDDGLADVTALAQRDVERDLSQHRHVVAEPLGERRGDASPTARPEDLQAVVVLGRAVRAGEVAHVLDDAHDALVHHRGHGAGALGDLGGRLLRGRDDDDLSARQVLAERDRHVAGARGQVEQQGVEVAPVDVGQHLHQRPVEHRAAPGDDLVAARLEHA